MKTDGERLKEELILKEEQLLNNAIRNDASKIADLIQNGCIEILSSGKQQIFQQGQLFGNADGELYIISKSEKMIDLSDDCKLLLYVAGKVSKNERLTSSRSSIWKKIDGKWKMIFHQGTNFIV